ncbi:hypothetical protein V6N13_034604 [Hibiscus sabdariffa]|uniref:Uncharacterized protein n=2 Tax=Hibiscus sabdariffa TaxID=183260 RepID=A0ABR2AUR5_9ROSI
MATGSTIFHLGSKKRILDPKAVFDTLMGLASLLLKLPLMATVHDPLLVVATAPIGTIVAPTTNPQLAAATTPLGTTVTIANGPKLVTTTAPIGTTVAPIAFISNEGHPPVTLDLGVHMALNVSPISFIGLEGSIDFFATPAETNNDSPIIFDNISLSTIHTTILPTNRVGELDNDMGKSFLPTSSMLFVFDE